MRQQVGKLLGEQVAAVGDHRIFGVAALGDVVHLLFQLGRHLRMRDVRGELVKSVANRHAQLAGLDGVVLDVLHRVQALDDAVARGLRAQAQLLHLLDQLALAVARRRLGLLFRALSAVEGDLLSLAHGGQLLVLLHAVRVDGAVARRHQHVALGREMLAAHFERDLRALHHGRIRQRCQESACDEVVQLVIGRCQVVGRGLGRGIDGWMVGGLLLAARSVQLAGGEQLLAIRGVRRVARDGLHHFGQVKRTGIHRVVDTRIGDIAVHVQAFGDAHGSRRRKALRRGRGHEAGGVERHGRLLLARALLHRRHRGACRARNGGHGRLRRRLLLEAGRGVRRREGKLAVAGGRAGSGAGVEGALDHPVVLGDERQALALARHDQRQRGRLHAAGAAHVAVAGELDQREVAREHRAPDQVDILAGCAGRGKVRIKLHQVRERVRDLLFRESAVTGAGNRRRGIDLLDARQSIRADQLALTVEVGRDDDGVRLLRQVLQAADDLLLLRELLDRRVDQIRQGVHLPRLQLNAVLDEGLLLFKRRARQASGQLRRDGLALRGDASPAAALLIYKSRREIGL